MHTNSLRNSRANLLLSRPARVRQFQRYLASAKLRRNALQDERPGMGCGQHLARLIAHDIRVVQTFDDHAWVIGRLWDSGEAETLFRVAASGLLHGLARELYRLAIELWLGQ
jgi:hypothetical protein